MIVYIWNFLPFIKSIGSIIKGLNLERTENRIYFSKIGQGINLLEFKADYVWMLIIEQLFIYNLNNLSRNYTN